MSGALEDIDIVDLDVARTSWSRVHSSMRTVYLKLSREPDVAWTRHFFEERGKRVNPRRHGLWIEDDFIVLDCFVNEVESHHLPDLRRSIDYANRMRREHVERHREHVEQSRDDARGEQDALAALRARIRGPQPASDAPIEIEKPAPPAIAPEFATKRGEWQARFRAALSSRKKEPERGND